jgi:outer membrane receptor protein involved in Fe transport
LVGLRHTWLQRDDWQIASGLPALDYVGHDSNSSGGGGAENRVELRATYFRDGLGLRMEANWEDGITSLPNPDGSINLEQSELLTVDVSAHYKFRVNGRFGGQLPWLDRVRVRLQVENLFNERYRVRDQFGNTTSGRSGDELDPYGRTITLQVRKLFD